MPSDDVNLCFAMMVDAGGQSASPYDDMSDECIQDALNLEFKIARRPGFPATGSSTIHASCVASELPQVDCPNLD